MYLSQISKDAQDTLTAPRLSADHRSAAGPARPRHRPGRGARADRASPRGAPRSVDIELVAFRVLHPDRVVVEPFLGQCASDGGAQAGEPAGLGVDSFRAGLDRVGPLATGVD